MSKLKEVTLQSGIKWVDVIIVTNAKTLTVGLSLP